MAMLATRPDAAKRFDEVRGCCLCPHPSHIYSPPRASRFAAFYSVSATYSCSFVRRPQLSYGYTSPLRSLVTCRCITP